LPFQANPEVNESIHSENPLTFKLDHRSETKQYRSSAWHLAYKILKAGDWKSLAEHWSFTKDQVSAIEEQWTGAVTRTPPGQPFSCAFGNSLKM